MAEKTIPVIVRPVHDIFLGPIGLTPPQTRVVSLSGLIRLPTVDSRLENIEWTWEPQAPPFLNIEVDGLTLRVTPTEAFPDTVSIRFTATDTVLGVSDTADALFYRTTVFNPFSEILSITLPEEIDGWEDEPIEIHLDDWAINFPGGPNNVTWDVEMKSAVPWLSVTIRSGAVMTITALPDSSGEADVTVFAQNQNGVRDSLIVRVRIREVHDITPDTVFLAREDSMIVDLATWIGVPNPLARLGHFEWSWTGVDSTVLRIELRDFRTLIFEASRVFPSIGALPTITLTAKDRVSGRSDNAPLHVVAVRRPPTITIQQIEFIQPGEVKRIVPRVHDDIDATEQIRLEARVPEGQTFRAHIEENLSRGIDALLIEAGSETGSLGEVVLIAENTDGLRDSVRIVVHVVPGPELMFGPIEMGWRTSEDLILDENRLRRFFPEDTLLVAIQSGIKVKAELLSGDVKSMPFSEISEVGHIDTVFYPLADSLTTRLSTGDIPFHPDSVFVGTGRQDTLRLTAEDGFWGLEWIALSVINKRTGLSHTAGFPVYVGVLDQNPKRPVPEIPLPQNLAQLDLNPHFLGTGPRGTIAWTVPDSFDFQQPAITVFYFHDDFLLNRAGGPDSVGNNSSSRVPDSLTVGRPHLAVVLVQYDGLFCYMGEPLLFVPDRAPGSPLLIVPSNGDTLTSNDLLFQIIPSIDQDGQTARFSIQISRTADFNNIISSTEFPDFASSDTLALRLSPTHIATGGNYFVRAVSRAAGRLAFSSVRRFTLYSTHLLPDVRLKLNSPEVSIDRIRRVMDPRNPFSYGLDHPDSVRIASIRYTLRVASNLDLLRQGSANILNVSTDQTSVSVSQNRLVSNRAYFLVLSTLYEVATDTSRAFYYEKTDTMRFIANYRPDAPVLLRPTHLDTLVSPELNVTWQQSQDLDNNALEYVVRFGMRSTLLREESVSISGLKNSTRYVISRDSLPSGGEAFGWLSTSQIAFTGFHRDSAVCFSTELKGRLFNYSFPQTQKHSMLPTMSFFSGGSPCLVPGTNCTLAPRPDYRTSFRRY